MLETIRQFAEEQLVATRSRHACTHQALPELGTAITHLREVLGAPAYESLARKGETMTTTAKATYAYDQIDQARTELEYPS
jgi:hypothetical protein